MGHSFIFFLKNIKMNFSVRALNCFYITIRRFQCPTVNLSISAEARILGKIMRGSKKAKKSRYIPQDASHLVVPELVGESAKGNAKVTNRRVSVLNSLYLEKITDLMSSSEFDRKLLDHGFVITRVNELPGFIVKVFLFLIEIV